MFFDIKSDKVIEHLATIISTKHDYSFVQKHSRVLAASKADELITTCKRSPCVCFLPD
jgi:hypothetical protein